MIVIRSYPGDQHAQRRPDQNREIQPQAPSADEEEIQAPPLGIRETVSALNLPEAG